MSEQKACSVEGCEKPYCAKGYCEMHYQQLRKHGDALGGRCEGAGLDWLKNAVETTVSADECLLGWPYGSCGGYPRVKFEGKAQAACRVVLIFSGIEPTHEQNLCRHSCDNPHEGGKMIAMKDKQDVRIWIFGKFPKLHTAWTYAVHAVSLADARGTMNTSRSGGTLLRKVSDTDTIVNASCGIISEAAQAIFRESLRQFMEEKE